MAYFVELRSTFEYEDFPPLHTAAYKGDLEQVKNLLKTSDINEKIHKLTALDLAILFQQQPIVQILLEQPGIEVNHQDGQKWAPLLLAACMPWTNILQVLLDHKEMEINYNTSSSPHVLYSACKYGQTENVAALLKHGVISDWVGTNRCTASHRACHDGQLEAVKLLKQHDFLDISSTNIRNRNSIQEACSFNQINIVKHVMDNFKDILSVDFRCEKGQQFICGLIKESSHKGHAVIVHLLIGYIDWTKNHDLLYSYVVASMQSCKYITSGLLLDEMQAILDKYTVSQLEKLWILSVKSGNKEIIHFIYSMWLNLGLKTIKNFELQRLAALKNSYGIHDSDDKGIHLILYYAIHFGITEQVRFILKLYPELSSQVQDIKVKGIRLCDLAAKHPGISKLFQTGYPEQHYVEDTSYSSFYYKVSNLSTNIKKAQDTTPHSTVIHEIMDHIAWNSNNSENAELKQAIAEMLESFSKEISKQNPLFSFQPILVGSAREGTRPLFPDEFDYLLIFKNLQQLFNIEDTEFLAQCKMSVKKELLNGNTPDLQPLLYKGQINAAKLFEKLKYCFELAKETLVKESGIHPSIHFEPNFYVINSVPCMYVRWRGQVYKDIEIKIDLVHAFEYSHCEHHYSVISRSCMNYTFFKIPQLLYEGVYYDRIAFSNLESIIIESLPNAAKEGFKFAKAMRIGRLFPQHIAELLRHDAKFIDDFLTTYMLKNCLFYCALYNPDACKDFEPLQWTYLIYKHLEARLVKGILPNLFGVHFTFPWPSFLYDEILFCPDPLKELDTIGRACCVKRQKLLHVTQWILYNVIEPYCLVNVTGFQPDRLARIAKEALDYIPPLAFRYVKQDTNKSKIGSVHSDPIRAQEQQNGIKRLRRC